MTWATVLVVGSVQLVAGADTTGTSVVLGLDSTFIPSLGRAEVPPGLRAPGPGVAPNIKGSWSIAGIPDGKYVILAAFENDHNVQDPDPGIAGTTIVRLTVAGGVATTDADPAFKITIATPIVSPGADGIEETSATPTFTWQKTPSNSDAWQVKVFDSLGNEVWSKDIASAGTTSVAYDGATALQAGRTYQWRITAMRNGAPTSHSEELRGLFIVK